MIQACQAAFTASFAYETSRLLDDLNAIDPELAAQLRQQSVECFTQAPAFKYFKNILNSAF